MSGENGARCIGLAGWSEAVSRHRASFLFSAGLAPDASALATYAAAFDFVEINASFYRQFRPATYEGWAAEVPAGFCFSVKMHRLITHYTQLERTELLEPFFESVSGLGNKLCAILIQLPPSLAFDPATVSAFCGALRERYEGTAVCEPRHASWTCPDAANLMASHRVGLVRTEIPDPPCEEDAAPATPLYLRLHGAPRRYYSAYSDGQLERLAELLRLNPRRARFVVFDNTASSAGVRNASALLRLVGLA